MLVRADGSEGAAQGVRVLCSHGLAHRTGCHASRHGTLLLHTYVVSSIWVALLRSPSLPDDSGRKPWDILRFVKTVAYFNDPPTPDKFFANLAKQLLPQQQVRTGVTATAVQYLFARHTLLSQI